MRCGSFAYTHTLTQSTVNSHESNFRVQRSDSEHIRAHPIGGGKVILSSYNAPKHQHSAFIGWFGISKTLKIMFYLHSSPEFSHETSRSAAHMPDVTNGQRGVRSHAQMRALGHVQSACAHHMDHTCALRKLGRHQGSRSSLHCPPTAHNVQPATTDHKHSCLFAHILRSLHALGRPAIARHRPAPVRDVGALPAPLVDMPHCQGSPCCHVDYWSCPGKKDVVEVVRPGYPLMTGSNDITSAICAAGKMPDEVLLETLLTSHSNNSRSVR